MVCDRFSLITFTDDGEDPLADFTYKLGGNIHYEAPDDFKRSEDGSIVVHGPGQFDIYISSFTGPLRDRFTLAHELGHYFLHSNQGKTRIKASRCGGSKAEWEANWFAAALLMPKVPFANTWQSLSHKDSATIAALFRVSKQAAEYRIKSLALAE